MTAHFGHTELDAGSEAPRLRIVLSEGPLELRWTHCSLTADFIADLFAGLAARGARLLNDPRPGAGGHIYVFVHPASTGGVLLELIQESAT